MFLAVSFAGISISAKDYRLTSPGENLKVKEDFFGAVSEKSGTACSDPVVGDRRPCTVAGEVTSGGVGVPDVCVTDGFSVVVTDEEGRYSLHADPEAGFVYLSVPSGYRVDTGGSGSPVFYRSIAEEKKRKESDSSDTLTVDFSLSVAAGDEFSAFPVGEDPLNPACVVVNVWNWDPDWKVCWYEDGVFRGFRFGRICRADL